MGSLPHIIFASTIVLAILQVLFGVLTHSSLLQISLATSLLVIISLGEKIFVRSTKGSSLLFRVAALVVYIAMIFINLSHCLEELTDFGNRDDHSDHDNHDHTHNKLYHYEYAMITVDVLIKLIFCITIPPLAIPTRLKNSAIVLIPSICIMGASIYEYFNPSLLGDWMENHLEPMIAATVTMICYIIIIPSIIQLIPYLLADSPPPDQFDMLEIENKAKNTIPNLVNISHVHANREWPEGFKVTMRAQIKISKMDPQWVTNAAESFNACKKEIHDQIMKAGANKVVIEPIFVDPNEDDDYRQKIICIDQSCHSKDVGCCTVRSDEDACKTASADNV